MNERKKFIRQEEKRTEQKIKRNGKRDEEK